MIDVVKAKYFLYGTIATNAFWAIIMNVVKP